MDKFENELLPWLGKTVKMLDYLHSNRFKDNGFDLTKEQWVLLKVLSLYAGVSQNEVACLTNRDKTAMTRLINTMEKKNFIARIPSKDDKRINLLYITKKGNKILNDTEQLRVELVSDVQKGVTSDEIALVIGVMKKIQNNINKTEGC